MPPRGWPSYARSHPSHTPAISIARKESPGAAKIEKRKTRNGKRRSLLNISRLEEGRGQRVLATLDLQDLVLTQPSPPVSQTVLWTPPLPPSIWRLSNK